MMRQHILCIFGFFVFIGANGLHATTFRSYPVNCPICVNPTSLTTTLSFHDEIFKNDPKYDLVYFKDNNSSGLFICSKCGLVLTGSYIFQVADDPVMQGKVRDYLERSFMPDEDEPPTRTLSRMRELIELHKIGINDRAWENQQLIFLYRSIDPEIAESLAREQIELIEAGHSSYEYEFPERCYLLGEYNRMVGNKSEARQLLKQAITSDTGRFFYVGLISNSVLLLVDSIFILGLLFFIIRFRKFIQKKHLLMLIVAAFVWIMSFMIHERLMDYYNFEYYFRPKYSSLAKDRINLLNRQSNE